MEPKSVNIECFQVLGLLEHFQPGKEDFSGIWKRFMKFHTQLQKLSTNKAYYSVYFETENKELDYLAGMKVLLKQTILEGLTLRKVPSDFYAIFECTVETLGNTYDCIFDKWFSMAPYDPDQRPDFNYYPRNTTSRDMSVTANMAIKETKVEEI
jgi:predicted transcriptional regulator YdeE